MMAMTIKLPRTQSTSLIPLNTSPNEEPALCAVAAFPRVQGKARSPSRSRTKRMNNSGMLATIAAMIAVAGKPQVVTSTPDTAAVAPQPTALPKLMNALSRPCSRTGVRSIDMPSTATSCVAAKVLMSTPISINKPTCSAGRSTNISASKDNVRPSCAPITHGRRLPMGRYSKRSINGPVTNLNAQGNVITAR